ncbi:hypothetical protein [Rhizobium laguerreae]|uniref:hypothetical protein n=1 Tax=Rhizobium laguerreae TaxID=1076926 RepID=UPI003CCE6875
MSPNDMIGAGTAFPRIRDPSRAGPGEIVYMPKGETVTIRSQEARGGLTVDCTI